jgi:nucleoside-diphosphate-sugar epimerase
MKVVVTGAGGFVGRHLVPFLSSRSIDVLGLDVHAPDEAPAGVRFVACDIRDRDGIRRAFAGADAVVHMASAHLQVGLPESEYLSVNVEPLAGLLRAAAEAGARHFVHTSSVGVHGSLAQVPGDEESPFRPENVYERTKAAGEGEVKRAIAAGTEGMGVTIVRPAWIYGPGDARTEKILRSVASGTFALFGSGANYRHPIYVSDYLDGVARLLLNEATYGRTYILAGPRYLRTRELLAAAETVTGGRIRLRVPLAVGWLAGLTAEAAFRLFGGSPPISRRTLAFFSNQNAFDIGRARRDFGFAPSVELEDGLARTWRAMRDGPLAEAA